MDHTRDAEPYLHQTDLVTQFFRDTDLAYLESGSNRSLSEPTALIDDRKSNLRGNIDEDAGLCRRNHRPLNPRQLFLELRKPRYPSAILSSKAQDVAVYDEAELDAERRIVYITNANSWSILAIIATASTNQAMALRGFISKYLNMHALVSVSVFPGTPRFALEVHLPYYAWRKGSQPNTDSRVDGTGRTLRKVRCLPFLHGNSHENDPSDHSSCQEHIYQTQLSFLVSGIDDWSWVGYCFVDTYHDGSDSDDAVQNYPSPDTSPDKFPMEAASGDNLPASPPFWSPRVYFLQVLQHRLGMVKDEWSNVVSMIQLKTQSYTHGLSLSRQLAQLPEGNQRSEKLGTSYEWTHNTIRLLLDLKHTLSMTINAWDEFGEFEIGYFLNGHSEKDEHQISSAILAARKHIKEMKALMNALDNQMSLCDNIAEELGHYLNLEDNRTVNRIQLQNAEDAKRAGKRASEVTFGGLLLVSIPSLSAAMFSMDSDVLPFNPTWSSFLITTFIIAFIVVAFLLCLRIRLLHIIARAFQHNVGPTQMHYRLAPWIRRKRRDRNISTFLADEPVEEGIELNSL